MRLFSWAPDGGKNSGVKGFFICEFKSLFSIAILKFSPNHRDAYHNHAFNAITLWIKGHVAEELLNKKIRLFSPGMFKRTPRELAHRIKVLYNKPAWAITFRGPWAKTWKEWRPTENVVLSQGREVIGTF